MKRRIVPIYGLAVHFSKDEADARRFLVQAGEDQSLLADCDGVYVTFDKDPRTIDLKGAFDFVRDHVFAPLRKAWPPVPALDPGQPRLHQHDHGPGGLGRSRPVRLHNITGEAQAPSGVCNRVTHLSG